MTITPVAAQPQARWWTPERLRIIAVYALASLVALAPILLVDIPALTDYPNHLARMHIMASINGDPSLRAFYEVAWTPAPNLAMDLLLPPLIQLVGTFAAGKIFVAAALLLPVAGVAALHAALFGRVGIWPAAAFLFVYNQPFAWGLLNFLFTSGFFLLALAAWIATVRWPPWRRLALSAGLSVLLYFGHFFAFSAYGLSIVGTELWRCRAAWLEVGRLDIRGEIRSWTFAMAQFLVPALLLLALPSWGGTKVTEYGALDEKLLALLSPVLSYGGAETLGGLVVLAGLVLLFLTGRLVLAPQLRYALVLLTIAALLMPNSLEGNWLADRRLPVLIFWVFIAGTRPTLAGPIANWGMASVCAIVMIVNAASIHGVWQIYDSHYAEFRSAAGQIPRGARVLPVQVDKRFDPEARYSGLPYLYWHLLSLTVIDRGIFYPILFTNPSAQPVRVAAAVAHLDVSSGMPAWPESLLPATDPAQVPDLLEDDRHGHGPIYWKDWQLEYDYVLLVRMGFNQPNPAPALLEPVAAGSFFDIYKVVRPEAGGSD